MKRWLLVALLAALSQPAITHSQPAPVYQSWFPVGTPITGWSIDNAGETHALPSGGNVINVCNQGSKDAYVTLETASNIPTPTTNGTWVQQSTCRPLSLSSFGTQYTFIGAITGGSDTTTLRVEAGVGSPLASKVGVNSSSTVTSFNTRTGAITLQSSDVSDAINGTVPFSLGTSLYPIYQNSASANLSTTINQNTSTCVSGCAAVTVGEILDYNGLAGMFPVNTYVTNVSGTTITTNNNASATLTNTAVQIGNDRWDTTSAVLANTVAGKWGLFGDATQGNSWWLCSLYVSSACVRGYAALNSSNAGGGISGNFAAKSSSKNAGGSVINEQCLSFVDDTINNHPGNWCHYQETDILPNALFNNAYDVEAALDNNSGTDCTRGDPYTPNTGRGCQNYRLDAGNGLDATAGNISVFIQTLSNGKAGGTNPYAFAGFRIQNGSIYTGNPNSIGYAIEMPQNHGFAWYSAANTLSSRLYSDAGSRGPDLDFQANALQEKYSGNATFSVFSSASCAGGTNLGTYDFFGLNASGSGLDYGYIREVQDACTAGAETGTTHVWQKIAGTITDEMDIGNGVVIGAPTGGQEGLGTLNLAAGGIYDNGTAPTGTGAYVHAVSPALTGTPSAPTAAANTNTTQLATTAYVVGQNYCQPTGSAGILSNNGSSACATDTNATLSAGALSLGASGTAGSVAMGNATSGTITLQPVSGALGSVTASLPANTGTIAETNLNQTWTASQTMANNFIGNNASGPEFFGNTAASATVPTLAPNKASTTTGWGASASGAIDGIIAGVDIFRIGTGSHVYGIGFGTASIAESGFLCYNSGSTPVNEILLDTATCLVSLRSAKTGIHGIDPNAALSELMQLQPKWYRWNQKTHPTTDKAEQPGLIAEDVAKVDKRLAAYTAKGELKGVRYDQMTAFLVAAIQAQQKEITELKHEVAVLEKRR